MKSRITVLLIIITFMSNAQDSINFSQLKFKNIEEKEFMLYAKWNGARPVIIPMAIAALFPDLDTNYYNGELLSKQEELQLNRRKDIYSDTIEKYGQIKLGIYRACILRSKDGNLPQSMWMIIYNKKGDRLYNMELANFYYGESGTCNILSFIKIDKKNKKIIILTSIESESWIFTEDEVREDGTIVEGDYCQSFGHDLNITSIDMLNMRVTEKEYYSEEKTCE